MADIFNKESIKIKQPITADKCTIHWDGQLVTTATNISISYSQPVSRRHTIGNNDAVILLDSHKVKSHYSGCIQ